MQVKVRVTVEKTFELPVSNFEEAVSAVKNNITPPDGAVNIVVIKEEIDGIREFRSVM